MTVQWTANALDHLQAIHDYIARNSPLYAQGMVDRLTKRTVLLATVPLIGRVVPEYGEETVREVVEGRYRIIYKVMEDRVDILAVIHGSRQLPSSLE